MSSGENPSVRDPAAPGRGSVAPLLICPSASLASATGSRPNMAGRYLISSMVPMLDRM